MNRSETPSGTREPEPEKLSAVIGETEGTIFRDEELVEHLERIAEAEDDLGDYEPE